MPLGRFFQRSDLPLCLEQMKDKIKEAYANSQKAAPNEESELNLDDHKKMHVFVETSSAYSVR